MPSFQFVAGPPTVSHSNPVAAFSPALNMSQGAFWGRPGGNPLSNAAVGAPITKGQSRDEFDYFSGASTDASEGEGHFLSLSHGSTLADEMRRKEPKDARGIATLGASMGNRADEEVSVSTGSNGRSSAKERIGRSEVDDLIDLSHRSLNPSLPKNTLRTEEPGRIKTSSPIPPPPTRRSESDPVQDQGHRSRGSELERRASFTEAVYSSDRV